VNTFLVIALKAHERNPVAEVHATQITERAEFQSPAIAKKTGTEIAFALAFEKVEVEAEVEAEVEEQKKKQLPKQPCFDVAESLQQAHYELCEEVFDYEIQAFAAAQAQHDDYDETVVGHVHGTSKDAADAQREVGELHSHRLP
jgi:hypothetical protein